ncbi:mediator of RNA polymerase II transcription subunit 4-like [Ptychodera flava]|uniref:mediator of RNA polymerase II transcription subunit 4-like n=1 Tax=Ptychodera flava TaxID=63121 RepID=UPI00396A5FA7
MATYVNTKAKLLSLVEEAEALTRELTDTTGSMRTQRTTNPEEPQLIDALVKKDEEIKATLKQAEAQGERQKEMEQLQEEVDRRDHDIKQLQKQLKEAEHILATAIYQAKEKLKTIEQANQNCIPADDLIKYAHHISATHSVTAPLTWAPGDPRRPYPTDIDMRMGLLGKMSNLPAVNGHQNGTTEGVAGLMAGASGLLSWQPSTEHSSSVTHNSESITNMDLSHPKDNEDDVEMMSTDSSSSSSSDSL